MSKLSHTSSQFDWISPSVICMSVATGVSSGLRWLEQMRGPHIHRHLEKTGFSKFLRTTQERAREDVDRCLSKSTTTPRVLGELFQVLGENFRSSQKKIAIFSSLMKPLGTPIPGRGPAWLAGRHQSTPLLHVMHCAASV